MKRKRSSSNYPWPLAIALIIVAILAVGMLVWSRTQTLATPTKSVIQLTTAPAETDTLVVGDGDVIWIQSGDRWIEVEIINTTSNPPILRSSEPALTLVDNSMFLDNHWVAVLKHKLPYGNEEIQRMFFVERISNDELKIVAPGIRNIPPDDVH